MSDVGNALLDQSDWIVESTAVVPGGAGLIVRALTFSLDADEASRAQALVTGQVNIEAVGALLADVLGVEGELYEPVRFTRDDWQAADANPLRPLLAGYAGLVEDVVDSEEVVGLLEELRLPVFASQPEAYRKIKDIGQDVQGIIGAVGTFGQVIGGHAGAVLVLISEIGVSVVAVGTIVLVAGLRAWDRLKRRRVEKKAAKAAAAAARQLENLRHQEEAAAEAAEREAAQAFEDAHLRTLERQRLLKEKAAKFTIRPQWP